jgi:hypothetical protein
MRDHLQEEHDKILEAWKMLMDIVYSKEIWDVDIKTRNKIRKVYNLLGNFPEDLNLIQE